MLALSKINAGAFTAGRLLPSFGYTAMANVPRAGLMWMSAAGVNVVIMGSR